MKPAPSIAINDLTEKIIGCVRYEDIILDVGFRCDFLIENRVIVECKAVSALTEIDQAQLLNY